MMKQALTIGQLIANAYPADTRLLFQQYGISVQPTGKTILDAYLVYGDQFLAQLLAIANKSVSRFSAADGALQLETDKILAYGAAATAKGTTAQQSQTSWIDKAFSIFNKTGAVLETTSSAWDTISGIFSGNKSVDTGNGLPSEQLQLEIFKLQQEAAKESAGNQTKTYLLIGAGLLVLILAFFMYQKRR